MLQNLNMNSYFLNKNLLELKSRGLQRQFVTNDVSTNVGFEEDLLRNNGN